MRWRLYNLSHLSVFKVVKNVLCILWTHVAVLRVLRVNVKLFWDLHGWVKRKGNTIQSKLFTASLAFYKSIISLTSCLRRCAGTSRAAGDVAAACSSTGAATSADVSSSFSSSSVSVLSRSDIVPSELTDDDLHGGREEGNSRRLPPTGARHERGTRNLTWGLLEQLNGPTFSG